MIVTEADNFEGNVRYAGKHYASTATPLLVVKQVLTFVNVYQSVVPDIINRKFYGYSKIIAASVCLLS